MTGSDAAFDAELVVPDSKVAGLDARLVEVSPDAASLAPPPRPDAAPPPPRRPDAAPPPPPPRPDAAPPPPRRPDAAPPPPAPWTDVEKCENMCQSYCVHKHMCDGSSIDQCRMHIDDADGGTCHERADLFHDISQARIEACIGAVEGMSCSAFLHMYNTGEGIPASCSGILR